MLLYSELSHPLKPLPTERSKGKNEPEVNHVCNNRFSGNLFGKEKDPKIILWEKFTFSASFAVHFGFSVEQFYALLHSWL
jgi:hypothetical protein